MSKKEDKWRKEVHNKGDVILKKYSLHEDVDDALINMDNKIEQLQAELSKHRWIPVSEPPKKSGEYWVCDFSDKLRPRYVVSWFALNGKGFNYSSVTHWKPIILPEVKE